MKVSILLAAYKSSELLEKVFLPSLSENLDVQIELIIYDNGGNDWLPNVTTDPIFPGPSGHKWITIGDGKNIGLNKALNECAKVATGDYFFLPHSDMFLMPGCLSSLVAAAKNQAPASFLFCSRSVEPTQGHTRHHIIKNYGQEASEFKEKELLEDFKDYKNSTIEVGARMPFFMHRNLWNRMSGVDENYFSYCTDDDLIQEAWDAGVRKIWMIHGSLCYHLQGKSNNQQKVDKDSNKPYEYFVDKWKKRGYPNAKHPGQWHEEMLPLYTRIK
jgi:GT2 family glycosyltransferase